MSILRHFTHYTKTAKILVYAQTPKASMLQRRLTEYKKQLLLSEKYNIQEDIDLYKEKIAITQNELENLVLSHKDFEYPPLLTKPFHNITYIFTRTKIKDLNYFCENIALPIYYAIHQSPLIPKLPSKPSYIPIKRGLAYNKLIAYCKMQAPELLSFFENKEPLSILDYKDKLYPFILLAVSHAKEYQLEDDDIAFLKTYHKPNTKSERYQYYINEFGEEEGLIKYYNSRPDFMQEVLAYYNIN